jgi:glycosyltransferase involved in cell wall biosynthesis
MKISSGLKISIITVCRNSEQFLAETIESVINQTYPNIEYIVIDGASTDSTVDIIKRYSSNITAWLSEPDTGMYDALNKGLNLATGDYILNLNSDDLLESNDTISKVVDNIVKERPDYFYGNLVKFRFEDRKYKKVRLFPVNFKQLLLSTHLTFASHPVFFISAKLNKTLGGYNSTYKNVSDYDYILRAMSVAGVKGNHINIYITKFRLHQNSYVYRAFSRIMEEREKVLTHYGYYKYSYLVRVFFYYTLWIYYKMINLGHRYKSA